ncbi:MAG: DNA internalization-related competence protein ComEC/Rec2, partial [Longimicrobiales bacterium]
SQADHGEHLLLGARGAAQRRLRALFPERAPLAEALVLARTESLAPAVRDRFVAAGLAHVLAISGMHVGVIAAGLALLARVLRVRAALAGLAAAGGSLAYVAFLGAPHAACRAGLQLALLFGARLLQRPSDSTALIAAAAITLLAYEPLALGQPGFQLSFAGTVGIVRWAKPIGSMLGALPTGARQALAAGLAATLATGPIAAWHFGQAAPIGLPATLIAAPLLSVALPGLALALFAAAIHPDAGAFLAGAPDLALAALDVVASAAARVPYGQFAVSRPEAVAWAGACLLPFVLARIAPRALGTARAGMRAGVLLAAGVASLTVLPAAHSLTRAGQLELHMLDVGQGDAIAIRTPGGRWILVDAGPAGERFDAGRSRVVPFLRRQGVSRLDLLVLTHPDLDHVGGAPAVLRWIGASRVIDPIRPAGRDAYLESLAEARRSGTQWLAARAGTRVMLDGAVLEILAPLPTGVGAQRHVDGGGAANDYSVVVRLVFGEFDALLMGDAPAAVEAALLGAGQGRRVEVLKVGHHGSATSTSAAWLAATRPQLALIPVGRRNRYGHPNRLVLARLERAGARVLRTDEHGGVSIVARKDGGYAVRTER